MRKSSIMKLVTPLLFGAAVALGSHGSAQAQGITFTWNPTGVGLVTTPAGSNIIANNIDSVSDYADITIPGATFNENAVIVVNSFANSGSPFVYTSAAGAPPLIVFNGLNSTYGFYATFTASGSTPALPASGSGTSSTGNFSTAIYTFWANPNGATGVTINSGGTPTISGNAGAFPLFSGTLVNGTETLTAPLGGGFSPTANLNLTLTACTASGQVLPSGVTCDGNESAFFKNPLPADINMVVGNFSATTTVTTLTPCSAGECLDINGGGGNITFAQTVPEPASLTLLGSSLLALGFGAARRRRKRS